jgi:DNA-binding protein Fis
MNIRKQRNGTRSFDTYKDDNLFIPLTLDQVEKEWVLRTLAYVNGNKMQACGLLGITNKSIYNKLHKWGLMK